MGYSTYFSGEVTIDPPLSDEEIAAVRSKVNDSQVPDDYPDSYSTWTLSDDGSTIDPPWDSVKAYRAGEELAYWVQHVIPAGHELEGYFHWEGEESDDQGRLDVEGRKVLSTMAEITYPKENASEVEINRFYTVHFPRTEERPIGRFTTVSLPVTEINIGAEIVRHTLKFLELPEDTGATINMSNGTGCVKGMGTFTWKADR